jgi:hypothetical protein
MAVYDAACSHVEVPAKGTTSFQEKTVAVAAAAAAAAAAA